MKNDLAYLLRLAKATLLTAVLLEPGRIREVLVLRRLEQVFSLERIDLE